MELRKQLQLMPVEMVYKGKVLVDLDKVLRIIDAETPEDQKILLEQDMVTDCKRVQEKLRWLMRTVPETRDIYGGRNSTPQDTRYSRERRQPEYYDEHG